MRRENERKDKQNKYNIDGYIIELETIQLIVE